MNHQYLSVPSRLLLVLVSLGATSRILLQIAAMPPYAGLDEIYHVGRVTFVASENRNPTRDEPSFPSFLDDSLSGRGAIPDFAFRSSTWWQLRAADYKIVDIALPTPIAYVSPNYEAQQPPLYYWVASHVVSLTRTPTVLLQLQRLRLVSATLAIITVVLSARLGLLLFGPVGAVAAATLPLFPTWETLLVRASNDALACAALALALLISFRGSNRWPGLLVEAIAWTLALAAKLYTWPVLAALVVLLIRQRSTARRATVVLVSCAFACALTAYDLRARTGNYTGLFWFDQASARGTVIPVDIDFIGMLKVFVASGIWTSGQHNNAMTPVAMALFAWPLAIAAIIWLRSARKTETGGLVFTVAVFASVAFAVAQAANANAFIHRAVTEGISIPAGGKEGWYWYALAPLVIVPLLSTTFIRFRWSAAFLVTWLFVWDVIIAEGALFRDYAGLSSSLHPSQLFRWGPSPVLSREIYGELRRFAAGPLTEWALELRLIAGFAFASLVGMNHYLTANGQNSRPEPFGVE